MKLMHAFEKAITDSIVALERFTGRWRKPLKIVFLLVFVTGLLVSVNVFDIAWAEVSILPLLISVLVMCPLNLAVAAFSFQLSAKAVKRSAGFWQGVHVSALSSIAELLPIPGGAIVRSAALVRNGAGAAESAWIVTLGAVMMLSLSLLLGSVPLMFKGLFLGYAFLVAGSGGIIVAVFLFSKRLATGDVFGLALVRVVGLMIGIVRITLAFAVLGVTVNVVDSALFVVATTLGSTSSLAPAGFGVSEAIAAAMALLLSVPPEAAFLAVALNRILGLVFSGFVTFLWINVISR